MAAEEKQSVDLNENQQKVLELVEKMTALELADLVKALEDKFGVSAAAPAAVAVAGAPAGDGEEAEEKSAFDVVLEEAGDKVPSIKAVKELTGVGLTDAKTMVEGAPVTVLEKADKAKAEEAKAKLEEVGCKVTLK